ncbi:FxsB family cyclophane-forming radical SAM/SPASM peptide maturase [Dactylosporangium sp. CS-033363]|uniref:FxsB family cyclophane-forming radical SAM/SPASM peptide maturase n=1 Tax=Dactylosporangium sp. CS-033363 TaxID=3239935 RepID=UPI003D91CEFF
MPLGGVARTRSQRSTTTSDAAAKPIGQVLLKIHSRCNLSCDYCYVYTHVDQTWRNQPNVMPDHVVEQAARRIAEHAEIHDLKLVTVILHGGEPLLAGKAMIRRTVETVRSRVRPQTSISWHLQTNGLLLDDEFLRLFEECGIRIGVSLDGGQEQNDRRRVFANGRGSYTAVASALHRLAARPDRYGGILCTIHLDNDPLDVYRELLSFAPPRIDFLLPHGNWTTPPPGRDPGTPDTPYADWLIPIFDEWFGAPAQPTGIRLFESILDLLLGGSSSSEAIGLDPVDLLIVETDGSIEQGDALKTTEPGMAATGLHIRTASFDDALAQPGFQARQGGLAGLPATCRACPVVSVCGGGLQAHRYRAENGFDNPSVYCPDLMKLIRHAYGRMAEQLQPG